MHGSVGRRWEVERGSRPVRIANCSGSMGDSGYQMLRQMQLGDVDFVTGDYLAELNLAQNAEAFAAGTHQGFEPTAWDGLQQSMDTINAKRVKVIINGGALNPLGLAQECQKLIDERGHELKVAAITGDNVLQSYGVEITSGDMPYLDSANPRIKLPKQLQQFREGRNKEPQAIVSAHAYLGARGIVKALEHGADIVICGRVADAAPVVAAAWWWYSWTDNQYDQLAGALIAGHLIECSAYVTGANFAGFDQCKFEDLFDLPFGIAEVEADGTSIITKHEGTTGCVTEETVKCQLLYEIQGDVYLNSDVVALLDQVTVQEIGDNRIQVLGVRGAPPPETTKLAFAYRAGFQSQILLNLGGYGFEEKRSFHEQQIRHGLGKKNLQNQFQTLDIQRVGTAQPDAPSMLAGTAYLRIFAAAATPAPLQGLVGIFVDYAMQHVSGMHMSMDMRTAIPRPYLGYFPSLYPQALLEERAVMLAKGGQVAIEVAAGHPSAYAPLAQRKTYDVGPQHPTFNNDPDNAGLELHSLTSFGPTRRVPLGDFVLGRSGDKGANVNLGLFVKTDAAYAWLRAYLTRARLQALMGDDWDDDFHVERCELPGLRAVHFVVYGFLGGGVSSTARLDCLGKGFADFIRARHVDFPLKLMRSL